MYRPLRETFTDDATAEESATVEKHFQYLQQLLSEGKLLLAGPTEDGQLGIAVIEADNEPTARTIMERDPAVSTGVFRGELLLFRLALVRN
jgi:uncharacterized protein YciI